MPALIFDLDGTLVDTVYAHIFSWQQALAEAGMAVDGWLIHRRIGMSGGLFTRAVARELGREISPAEAETLQRRHGELFHEFLPERRVARRNRVTPTLRERGIHTVLPRPAGDQKSMLR
jgi:beta-phosphoglucomutase-like phosphatase (HAD superfamily)